MIETTLIPLIETHRNRFREIETLLGDPAVAADNRRFVKLTKEYKHLGRLENLLERHKTESENIDFYNEVLAMEEDPAARAALADATAAVEAIEQDIKLFLIPADPEDDKNVIL